MIHNQMRSRRWRGKRHPSGLRRGVVMLEFIIAFPIFLFSIVAIIELGRAMMVQQILTNAAREGARRAVVAEATNQQVTDRITEYLQRTSLNGATPTILIRNQDGEAIGNLQEDTNPRDVIDIAVTVPYNEVGFGIYSYVSPDNMGAAVQMRKEL